MEIQLFQISDSLQIINSEAQKAEKIDHFFLTISLFRKHLKPRANWNFNDIK